MTNQFPNQQMLAIERVADKRHQRFIDSGLDELSSSTKVANYLRALAARHSDNEKVAAWATNLATAYELHLTDNQ